MHANCTFLSRRRFPRRANILLGAKIDPASPLIKLLLDDLALLLVLLAMLVLAVLIAIPDALARGTLFEGIAAFTARRTHFGLGLI